jgi:murein DD-endopeptidase MepM/ murein hydrolase activator NlpD
MSKRIGPFGSALLSRMRQLLGDKKCAVRARRRIGKLPSTARGAPAFIISFWIGNRPDRWIVVKERLLWQFHKALTLILELVDRARLWGLDAWNWMRQDARTGVDAARRRLNALSSNVNDWRTGKLQLKWRVLVTKPVVVATVAGFILVCGNLLLAQNGPNYQLASGYLPTGDALHLSTAQLLDDVSYINNPDTQNPVPLHGRPPQRNAPVSRATKPQPKLAPEGMPRTVAYVGGTSRGSGSGVVSWPARGPITSPFGWRFRGSNFHTGIDIGAGYGTSVDAATSGMVVLAGWDGGYGRCVLIDHGDGLATRYAHLSRIDVGLGERVNKGEIIGNVGESGNATGPHLHFEVIINGSVENPLHFLP